MSRPIKFRAWDKNNKKWLKEPQMFYMQNHEPFASTLHVHEQLGIELMQYTGIKDKNGVEIYEGDIVKEEDDGGIYQVKYFGDDDYPAFDLEPSLDVDSNGLSFLTATTGCEVLGNIYQKPELLESDTIDKSTQKET